MRRKLAATVVASALIGAVSASPAVADPGGGGAPENPSCYGQTLRTLIGVYGSAPAVAAAFGFTDARSAHNALREVCGRTSGIAPTP